MSEIDEAIARIAEIRTQLAHSTRFPGYTPEPLGLLAALSVVILAMQSAWPARFAGSDRRIVLGWGLLVGAGAVFYALEAAWLGWREAGRMPSHVFAGAARIVIPTAAAGAVLAGAVLAYAPAAVWLLPGAWQMLTGMAIIASFGMLPAATLWPGIWFMLAGSAGLLLAGAQGGLTPAIAGAPFIAGHFWLALVLRDRGIVAHEG